MPWWDKKYGKNAICAISMTRLRPGKNKDNVSYSIYLQCKHGFVRSAFVRWVESGKRTCPVCRSKFNASLI